MNSWGEEVVRMLALRLPAEIEERLEQLARRTGRSKSFYAREAILEHLEELEDRYLAQEAADEHFSSGAQTMSMDEVMDRYGR
jgi:RHH-type rel operon transcriptional repressor/antitoxin RelB